MTDLEFPTVGFPGITLTVVDSWVPPRYERCWVVLRPRRCPRKGYCWDPVRGKFVKRGTRKAWKRAHPVGLRSRVIAIPQEPDHVLRTRDTIICTAKQAAVLRQKIGEAA